MKEAASLAAHRIVPNKEVLATVYPIVKERKIQYHQRGRGYLRTCLRGRIFYPFIRYLNNLRQRLKLKDLKIKTYMKSKCRTYIN